MIEPVADVAPPLSSRLPRRIERSPRDAQADYRTDGASGLARQANGRAQFHHGLIEIARTLTAEQAFCGLPERLACQAVVGTGDGLVRIRWGS